MLGAFLLLVVCPAYADIIYFRDGRVLEVSRAWFEKDEVKFVIEGLTFGYPKKAVRKLEKGFLEYGHTAEKSPSRASSRSGTAGTDESPGTSPAAQPSGSAAAEPSGANDSGSVLASGKESDTDGVRPRKMQSAKASRQASHDETSAGVLPAAAKATPSPETLSEAPDVRSTAASENPESAPSERQVAAAKAYQQFQGLKFYDPRRPKKFWATPEYRFDSFDEAVAVLAKLYKQPPQWIRNHMGETNDLAEIHANLLRPQGLAKVTPSAKAGLEPRPQRLFYDPRREKEYWVGPDAHYNTFDEALQALADQYDRSVPWIREHLGETNDLDEIHRNLSDPNPGLLTE